MCLGRPRSPANGVLLPKIAEEIPEAGHLNKRGRPYKATSISPMLKS